MNKRIYGYMILLVTLSLLISGGLLVTMFAMQLDEQMLYGIRSLRVSIIQSDGTVVFDNTKDLSLMDDHSNRPEVADAIEDGIGESERFSETVHKNTYYYAIKLNDNMILRLALSADSLAGILMKYIPYVLVCLVGGIVLAFFLARRLTRNILQPINGIDLDNPRTEIYDELLPFINRIKTQREEILRNMISLEKRTDTINTITDNMREGIILLDAKGKILLANSSIKSIFSINDTEGLYVMDICRESGFKYGIEACLKAQETETQLSWKGRIYDVIFSPVKTGGGAILFIDVTEKHKARQQREEFSANVSHELKTPLTSISALSEMIADGTAKDEDVKSFAVKINKQAKRLVSTINDVIKLSSFDENSADSDFVDVDLCKVAVDVIADLSDKADKAEVSLELDCPDTMKLNADLRMMDELIYNLVDNGITYNVQGGKVVVSLKEDEEECSVIVSDTGIGIPQEDIGRIFERFYRVDKSRSRKTGGTGLGLSIVKHIVEFHKGSLEVKSDLGKGTTITCKLKK